MITITIADLMKLSPAPVSVVATLEALTIGFFSGAGISELAFRTFEKIQQVPKRSTANKVFYLTFSLIGTRQLFSFGQDMWRPNPSDHIVTSAWVLQMESIAGLAAFYFLGRIKEHWSTLGQQQQLSPPPKAPLAKKS